MSDMALKPLSVIVSSAESNVKMDDPIGIDHHDNKVSTLQADNFLRLAPPKALECDFHALSGRLRSTSTPFIPRTSKTSSVCVTPTIEESLEDSAIGAMESFKSLSNSDDAYHSIMSSVETYRIGSCRVPTRSEPRMIFPKLSLFQDEEFEDGIKPLGSSFHAVSEDCLISPSNYRDIPCLHCSRDKSHSDTDLLTQSAVKYSASFSHNKSCSDSRKRHLKRRSCPSKLEKSHESSLNHSEQLSQGQDTGYQSQFSISSFEQSSVDHSIIPSSSLEKSDSQGSFEETVSSSFIQPTTHVFKVPDTRPKHASSIDFTLFLQKFAPRQLDRLIGRKIGCKHIDIVSELVSRNQTNPLGLILRYISEKDLISMCRVNDSWRSAVENNVFATKRLADRKARKLKQTTEKENYGKKRSPGSGRGVTVALGPLTPVQLTAMKTLTAAMTHVQDNMEIQHAIELSHKYWKEAEQLRNEETLRKCPQCSSPAVTAPVQDRARCTRCSLDFCIRCRNTFHGSRPCGVTTPKKQRPEMKVCCKKSKKNLRRL